MNHIGGDNTHVFREEVLKQDSKKERNMKNCKLVKESINDSEIKVFVNKTNTIVKRAENLSKLLFQSVTDAFHKFGNDPAAWKKYKTQLKVDRSSINKMTKVLNCKVIQSNLDALPDSWLILHKISMLDETVILDLLSTGVLKKRTTNSQINEIRQQQVQKKVTQSIPATDSQNQTTTYSTDAPRNFIAVDYSTLDSSHLEEVDQLLNRLASLGFAVARPNYEIALAA
jgi:hypothetical protein